jgi:hypothetical protein
MSAKSEYDLKTTIAHTIDNTQVVWFEKSNQWVQMDEPQGFIFLLYQRGISREEAAAEYAATFSHDATHSLEMVNNLYDSVELLQGEGFPLPDFSRDAEAALHYELPQSRSHHYRMGNKTFSIRYGSPALESYIHYPFAHLEDPSLTDSELLYEVFPFRSRFALRIAYNRCLTTDESPQLKRLLFQEMAGHLYNIPTDGWLTYLHASAVVADGRLLLLASPSGSGKSTLAALLQKQGHTLFADDYIPVCIGKQLAYPFPAALSLKPGSLPALKAEDIIPDLMHREAGFIQHHPESIPPLPATVLIFVKYIPGADTHFEKISTSEALYPFLQEAWVSGTREGAEAFMAWFKSLSVYRLEYGGKWDGVMVVMSDVWKDFPSSGGHGNVLETIQRAE